MTTSVPPMMTCGCRAQATIGDSDRPACGVHDCTTVADEPDLTGRKARCSCGKIANSDASDVGWTYLPFFEYRGPGSADAARVCKTCRYHDVAHVDKPCWRCGGTGTYQWAGADPLGHARPGPCTSCSGTGVRKGITAHVFEPIGPYEFDSWYCGHSGWD